MINKTYNLKSINASIKNNLPFFILISVYITGLFLSVLHSVTMQDAEGIINDVFSETVDYKKTAQIIFIINLIYTIVFFLNGFCMLGKPFTMLLLLTYSFLLGSLLIIVFRQQNTNNIFMFSILYIFPAVLFSISQISACVQSVFFSEDLYNNYFKNSVIKTKIRTYLKRYALILLLNCSGGVMMSIVAAVFIR